ncbi:zinc finger MYM-type protein 6 [Trichonephila clavipes]|nr:zinc finger MYM-type protein 6 [Trichonephila clavipes]
MRSQNSELNAPSKKIRKYNEEFIKYGLTFCVVDDEERPICVIFNEKLANESMKPAKLKRYLETKHKELKNKHADFFQRPAENLNIHSANLKKFTTIPQKSLLASLEVSYLKRKTMKPHTIGESLILPAATKMTSIMHGDKYGNELKTISSSRDTVSRWISEMSRNIESEVIKCKENSSVFALQLDETTDITKISQLIIYVRFIFNEDITETCFFMLQKFGRKNNWRKNIRTLTGSNKGLRGLIHKVAPHIIFNHCMIHRQALVAKDMDEELHNILQDAVSSIDYIKCHSLNSRLFSILCYEMGSTYERLLLHTEVSWLSRGKILRRIFDLRNEVYMFLSEKRHRLGSYYINEVWLGKLSYLELARRLAEGDLGLRRPLRVLSLTPTHRRIRMGWCRARGNWTAAKGNQVVFNDESRFNLSSDVNGVRVWRPRGECLNPAFALQRHTAPWCDGMG